MSRYILVKSETFYDTSDQNAIKEAEAICQEEKRNFDNNCTIISLTKQYGLNETVIYGESCELCTRKHTVSCISCCHNYSSNFKGGAK